MDSFDTSSNEARMGTIMALILVINQEMNSGLVAYVKEEQGRSKIWDRKNLALGMLTKYFDGIFMI